MVENNYIYKFNKGWYVFLVYFFDLFFRGLFQYGDLHFGHIMGSSLILVRGIHSCPHLPHLWPSFCIFISVM